MKILYALGEGYEKSYPKYISKNVFLLWYNIYTLQKCLKMLYLLEIKLKLQNFKNLFSNTTTPFLFINRFIEIISINQFLIHNSGFKEDMSDSGDVRS
jgi:hypothetical protein